MEQQKAEEEARKAAQANWARQMQLKQFADERAAADRASREAIAKAREAASEAHWNDQAKRDLAQHAERMAALKRQRETANKRWNITQNQRANKTKIGALEKQLLGYGKDISDALFNDRPEIAASLTPLYNKIAAQLRELGYPAEDYGGSFLQPKPQEVPGLPKAQGFNPQYIQPEQKISSGVSGGWNEDQLNPALVGKQFAGTALNLGQPTTVQSDLPINPVRDAKYAGLGGSPMIPTKPGEAVYIPQYGAVYKLSDDGKNLIKVK